MIAPPGLVSAVVLCALCSWLLRPALSLAAWSSFTRDPFSRVLIMFAVLSLVQIPVGWLIHRELDSSKYPPWRFQRLRRCGMFALLLTALIASARPWIPLTRFHASRAALEAQITAAARTGSTPCFCRIGQLDVEYIHMNWRVAEVFVQTEHDVRDNRYGFVYDPGRAAKRVDCIAPGWFLY